ncbi:tetratricopeptide repeat protein, partial [Inconstantimicrobium porci]
SYFVLKQYDDCIDMYKKLIKAAPASSWMFCNMGDLYCYSGDFKNAFTSFNEAIKIDPLCTTAYYYKSRLYSLLRQSENALKCLEKAISLNPDYKKIALNDELLNNIKLYTRFKELVKL